MNWTNCLVIEVMPDRMSGAPVLRHSRIRLEDLLANQHKGAVWLADAHGLPLEDVKAVLAFYEQHKSQLASAV